MDKRLEELLEKNGLSGYVPIFQENCVDIDIALCLTKDFLASLIPPIGHRILFLRAIAAFKADSAQAKNENPSKAAVLNETSTSTESQDNSHLFVETPADSENDNQSFRDNSQIDTMEREKQMMQTEKLCVDVDLTYDTHHREYTGIQDLERLLSQHPDGQQVLSIFHRDKKLNKTARDKLTNVVVNHLISTHGCVKNCHFQEASDSIARYFKTESAATYYVPPYRHDKTQKISKGKLPFRYRNVRSDMKKNGVNLISPSKRIISQINVTPQIIDTPSMTNSLSSDEFNEAKTWLAHNSEPWTKVINLWAATSANRMRNLHNPNLKCDLAEVLQEWPLLKNPLAHILISIDFKTMFETKEMSLFIEWPQKRLRIEQLLREKVKDKRYIDLLQSISADTPEDVKDAVIFYLLPVLVPPSAKRRKDKDFWKPTTAESQEGFVIHVRTLSDMFLAHIMKCEKMKSVGCTVQPYIVLQGPSVREVHSVYVRVNDTSYQMENVLFAVDVCFKVFHTLNLQYPPEAHNVWTFLQKQFYGLSTVNDRVSIQVNAALSEMQPNASCVTPETTSKITEIDLSADDTCREGEMNMKQEIDPNPITSPSPSPHILSVRNMDIKNVQQEWTSEAASTISSTPIELENTANMDDSRHFCLSLVGMINDIFCPRKRTKLKRKILEVISNVAYEGGEADDFIMKERTKTS